jgi:hypothetical protein
MKKVQFKKPEKCLDNFEKEINKRYSEKKENLQAIQKSLEEIKQRQDKVFLEKIQNDIEYWYKNENLKSQIFIDISLFVSSELDSEVNPKWPQPIVEQKEEKILKCIQNEKEFIQTAESSYKVVVEEEEKKKEFNFFEKKLDESFEMEMDEKFENFSEVSDLKIKKISIGEECKIIGTQVRKIKNYWCGFTQTHPFIFKKCQHFSVHDFCEESKDFSNKILYKLN